MNQRQFGRERRKARNLHCKRTPHCGVQRKRWQHCQGNASEGNAFEQHCFAFSCCVHYECQVYQCRAVIPAGAGTGKERHSDIPAEYGALGHYHGREISVASVGPIKRRNYSLFCRSCGRNAGICGQGWTRGNAQKLHLAPADRDSETHVRHGSGFPVLFFCKGTGGLPVTESQILSSFLVSVTNLLTITNRANLITRLTLFCFIFCIDYV